ncbi:hypothetical protein GW17_00051937 [Ensete ventricosum]|nr:hypothetical protein GW17_00051937 [Ensete ventricosum]
MGQLLVRLCCPHATGRGHLGNLRRAWWGRTRLGIVRSRPCLPLEQVVVVVMLEKVDRLCRLTFRSFNGTPTALCCGLPLSTLLCGSRIPWLLAVEEESIS